ncbi:MAG: imelysin family protein [Myxococcota bacterium]
MKVNFAQFIGAIGSLALFTACPVSKPQPADNTTKLALLEAAGACSLDAVQKFRAEATALAASPTKDGWKRAMTAWQRVEAMQFGPTGSSTFPAGQDFRDQLYSWPLVSRCAVDDVLVSKAYEGGVDKLLVNRRGLAALEYLLFYEGDDVSCSQAGWAALDATEKAARKQAYAAALATDVKARADALVAAWEGGYLDALKTAGSNATYPSAQLALNRVTDALFNLEDSTKELKLSTPLGIHGCTPAPCLDQLESQYAHHNTANVRANLVGFRQLLQGCGEAYAGVAFDDLLEKNNAGGLAQRLVDGTIAAQAALDAIEEPDLSQALVSDEPSVRALYEKVKAVTDLLKSEFVIAVDVSLPAGLEGDND